MCKIVMHLCGNSWFVLLVYHLRHSKLLQMQIIPKLPDVAFRLSQWLQRLQMKGILALAKSPGADWLFLLF